jgi:hypothetical protein
MVAKTLETERLSFGCNFSVTYPWTNQPQQKSNQNFQEIHQVLRNEWLGGRDSNPDIQIQTPIDLLASQQDEQVGTADCGEVRQNPQCRRKEEEVYLEEETLP